MAALAFFGTDGIRDVAGEGLLSPAHVHRIGRAIGRHFVDQAGESAGQAATDPFILIGRDTRASGPTITRQLARALAEEGVRAVDLGVVPTAGVAFLARAEGAVAGVVVSASHNPAADNGIKIFRGDGTKAREDDEAAMEVLIDGFPDPAAASAPAPAEIATGSTVAYADWLVAIGGGEGALAGMSIAIDGANGAAYRIAPEVLGRLGVRVDATHITPDGTNINDGCGAVHPAGLVATVLAERPDLGACFDGDADRLILIDTAGAIHDGDTILAIWATHLHARGELPGDTVVGTILSNLGLELALAPLGVKVTRTPVGDKHIAKVMRGQGYVLGGEQSGHICYFGDAPLPATTGDGIAAAIHLLRIAKETGRSIADLAAVMKAVPQVTVNVPVQKKPPLDEVAGLASAVEAIEARHEGKARIVVRYSGTEPKMRVMIEGTDQATLEADAAEIARVVTAAIG